MVLYFLFLFRKNIGGSYNQGTGKPPDICPTGVDALLSFAYPNT